MPGRLLEIMEQNKELAISYEHCVKIIKRNSASFYTALRNLPKQKFLEVSSIYAFCRICDDIVDESKSKAEAKAKLDRLEEQLKSYKTAHTDLEHTLWWPAFKNTLEKYDMDMKPFYMQIEGQKLDLLEVELQNIDELIEYSKLVAGSVGLMLSSILAKDEQKAKDEGFINACMELGIAMQITNILRDIGEDLTQRNRVYVPKMILEKYGIHRNDLTSYIQTQSGINFEKFSHLWEELAQISERYYESIKAQILKFDDEIALSIYASAIIYKEILQEVRKNDYNCLTKRNYTNDLTRLRLVKEAKEFIKLSKSG